MTCPSGFPVTEAMASCQHQQWYGHLPLFSGSLHQYHCRFKSEVVCPLLSGSNWPGALEACMNEIECVSYAQAPPMKATRSNSVNVQENCSTSCCRNTDQLSDWLNSWPVSSPLIVYCRFYLSTPQVSTTVDDFQTDRTSSLYCLGSKTMLILWCCKTPCSFASFDGK